MEEERFASLGRVEAISRLYEGTPFKAFESTYFGTEERAYATLKSRCLIEGTDFDLTYFPLKHLGYKSVICVTGELYAEFSHPKCLNVVLGVSAKLDYTQIKELWHGIVAAAEEHGYKRVNLDLVPSSNGLSISISAIGETSAAVADRRKSAKSMDLVCVTGSLGAAFIGLNVLEREKRKFNSHSDDRKQPDLNTYKHFVGAYLKPELESGIIDAFESDKITPGYGYFLSKGLADAANCLVRDSGLGVKIYAEKVPFTGGSVDLSKELGIDPLAAALNGGDDCCLMFTLPITEAEKFRRDFQSFDIIGHLAKPEVGATIVTPDGVELPLRAQGWPKGW